MQSTTDRRQMILEYLLEHRKTTRKELSNRFGVSMRTIERDIIVLSCSYPIDTQQGGAGGIFIAEGYRLGMKYLTEEQSSVLEEISKNLTGENLLIVKSIINTFKNPLLKKHDYI